MYNISSTYLILGGARSGKSHYAEKLAQDSGRDVTYIATAKILDEEIQERVNHHKKNRPTEWKTIEEPIALAKTLTNNAHKDRVLLVDCLTMWITNLLSHDDQALLHQEIEALVDSISELPGHIIFVSNEISMGVIPMGELTRQYVDEAGRLHQLLAQQVNHVVLMVAGIPNIIKSP